MEQKIIQLLNSVKVYLRRYFGKPTPEEMLKLLEDRAIDLESKAEIAKQEASFRKRIRVAESKIASARKRISDEDELSRL